MKKSLVFIAVAAIAFTSCDIDKKGKLELPDVDVAVDVEEGNLPEFDIDWMDVDVKMKTKTVSVPKVRIVMEEEEIQVPVIDVDMPGEDKEELAIAVEAEVSGTEQELKIQEVRATQRRIYVISTLKTLKQDLGKETMRIQDQIELNAPDLDVKHYIVGVKNTDRRFNNRYTYVSSMAALPEAVKSAKVIYKK
jgi:predicted small lipoprotein YifL